MKKIIKTLLDEHPKDVLYFFLEIYFSVTMYFSEHSNFTTFVFVVITLFAIYDLVRLYWFVSTFNKKGKDDGFSKNI